MFLSRKSTLALVLMLCSGMALAGRPGDNASTDDILKLKGDAKSGEEVYEVCSACHLKDGMGRPDGTLPVVSGQHARVLVKQMIDIRTGHRDNPTMFPFAQSMTPQEIADSGAYMATLKLKANGGKGSGKALKRGGELYKKDCQTCHKDNGIGEADKFVPMLTAQHYEYMVRQMEEMQAGKRKNADKDMIKIVNGYSKADIEAVADYMSRLKPKK
jgi:cytochrome c553